MMMNERIQQIVKQSGGHWNYGDHNMGSSVEFQEEDIEHFVRLIVQECVGQVFASIPDTMCSESGAYRTARLAAISSIKEHFGVKE
jgi:hypothetical protein